MQIKLTSFGVQKLVGKSARMGLGIELNQAGLMPRGPGLSVVSSRCTLCPFKYPSRCPDSTGCSHKPSSRSCHSGSKRNPLASLVRNQRDCYSLSPGTNGEAVDLLILQPELNISYYLLKRPAEFAQTVDSILQNYIRIHICSQ